jgi:hypothetical protein
MRQRFCPGKKESKNKIKLLAALVIFAIRERIRYRFVFVLIKRNYSLEGI